MQLVTTPDNRLRVKTRLVKKITPALLKLINEMVKMTKAFVDPEGVGLASTQIGQGEQFQERRISSCACDLFELVLGMIEPPVWRRGRCGQGAGGWRVLPSMGNPTTSMSIPICRCFGCCGIRSASWAPNTAAGLPNAAPARCTSTVLRSAPARCR